jgi:hypothetical protein
MNIELNEVVVHDVSDDALEQAASGALAGFSDLACHTAMHRCWLPF